MDPTKKRTPPATGRWKPGQSGNPGGRPKRKPFLDALNRLLDNNPEALDIVAAALVAKAQNGDVSAGNALADRLDGKVPLPHGGTDELPPIKGFTWIAPVYPIPTVPNAVLEGDATELIEDHSDAEAMSRAVATNTATGESTE